MKSRVRIGQRLLALLIGSAVSLAGFSLGPPIWAQGAGDVPAAAAGSGDATSDDSSSGANVPRADDSQADAPQAVASQIDGPQVDGASALGEATQQFEALQQAERQRQELADEALRSLRQSCETRRQETTAALSQLPGNLSRQSALDNAFLRLEVCAISLHDWLRQFREAAARSDTARSDTARSDATRGAKTQDADLQAFEAQLQNSLARLSSSEAEPSAETTSWLHLEAVVEDETRRRQEQRATDLDGVLDLLAAATRSRWQLAPKVSESIRTSAAEGLFTELYDEIEALPEVLRRQAESWLQSSRAWPAMLAEVLALRVWLWKAGLLLVLTLLWRRWRRRAEDFCRRIGHWLKNGSRVRPSVSKATWPSSTDRLVQAAAVLWTSCLDASLLVLFYALLLHRVEGSAPWVVIALLWICWRLVPALATLGIASPIEQRSALMVGNRSVRDRIAMTLRSILLWGLASLLLLTCIRQVLVSYRLYELAQVLTRWSLLLLVIYLLDRWAPLLRRQMRRLGDSRWSRWLGSPAKGRLANILKAACTTLYLCSRLLLLGVNRLFGGKGDLSWWTLRLARSDLQEGQKVRQPLEPEERQRIENSAMQLSRADDMDRLQRSLAQWQEEKGRDLAALIGHRGSGKTYFLDRLAQRVEAGEMGEGLEVTRWLLAQRLFGAEEALHWVLERLQEDQDGDAATDQPKTEADLRASIRALLEARPPSLFLVDDMHYLLLRTVGGFDAFKAIKTCMYESSSRHFWVLAFHRPAWSYLETVAVDINLDVFRTRLKVDNWKEEELATWLSGRTQEAGFELDFSRLVRRGPFDDESQQDLERARQSYWQLLTNASSGNPEVAMLYWLDSLCHESSGKKLAVTLFEEPSSTQLASQDDRVLFVLTALWMHGRLDPKTLVDVLNMPIGKVEMACRHLDSIDVLNERQGLGYALEGRWRPPVERLLRQRHFLHWEG